MIYVICRYGSLISQVLGLNYLVNSQIPQWLYTHKSIGYQPVEFTLSYPQPMKILRELEELPFFLSPKIVHNGQGRWSITTGITGLFAEYLRTKGRMQPYSFCEKLDCQAPLWTKADTHVKIHFDWSSAAKDRREITCSRCSGNIFPVTR